MVIPDWAYGVTVSGRKEGNDGVSVLLENWKDWVQRGLSQTENVKKILAFQKHLTWIIIPNKLANSAGPIVYKCSKSYYSLKALYIRLQERTSFGYPIKWIDCHRRKLR